MPFHIISFLLLVDNLIAMLSSDQEKMTLFNNLKARVTIVRNKKELAELI